MVLVLVVEVPPGVIRNCCRPACTRIVGCIEGIADGENHGM